MYPSDQMIPNIVNHSTRINNACNLRQHLRKIFLNIIFIKKWCWLIDKIENGNVSYVYLANEEDENDFFIRKEIIEEDETRYLISLDNEEEFDKALQLFQEKNK